MYSLVWKMKIDVEDDDETNMCLMMLENTISMPVVNLEKSSIENNQCDIHFENQLGHCTSDAEAVFTALKAARSLAKDWLVEPPADQEHGYFFRGLRNNKKMPLKLLAIQTASFFLRKETVSPPTSQEKP